MASSFDKSSYVPEITGLCFAALQMRQHPVFPVMTSSLMPEWDLKGVVLEGRGEVSAQQVCCLAILHGGLAHSFFFGSPGQSAMMIRFYVFFFSYTLSLLCSGKVIYSHRRLRAGGCQGLHSTDIAIICGI